MKLALFRWKDASLHGQITKFYDDIQGLGLITLVTVGIVVEQDDNKITLCMDYSPTEISWRSCQSYPKSCIEIIRYIDIPQRFIPEGAE